MDLLNNTGRPTLLSGAKTTISNEMAALSNVYSQETCIPSADLAHALSSASNSTTSRLVAVGLGVGLPLAIALIISTYLLMRERHQRVLAAKAHGEHSCETACTRCQQPIVQILSPVEGRRGWEVLSEVGRESEQDNGSEMSEQGAYLQQRVLGDGRGSEWWRGMGAGGRRQELGGGQAAMELETDKRRTTHEADGISRPFQLIDADSVQAGDPNIERSG